MKKIVIGTLAHVDAGKTTLTESLLYASKAIKKMGRVDHKDTFLDYNELERNRGITIFNKQVNFEYGATKFYLLDTPGHIDFSMEMERCLSVLDYAIVLISATDGVQAHTRTIFDLLDKYQIPAFIFVNKMDISYYDSKQIMEMLKKDLNPNCIELDDIDNLVLYDDHLFEQYMNDGTIDDNIVASLIKQRKIYPCFFGSALKYQSIDNLLNALDQYTIALNDQSEFGARVYKINYENNIKITYMKITGGTLKNKTLLNDEKIDQIRIYNGLKYDMVETCSAGDIVGIKGLNNIYNGQGLGFEEDHKLLLSTYMNYDLITHNNMDNLEVYKIISKLKDEDPSLDITYNNNHINIKIMGDVQIEILKDEIKKRFNLDVDFVDGSINYLESVNSIVEGVGHYEPLRHYAEVHLLLEPNDSGIEIVNGIENNNDMHYQNYIINYLYNTEFKGVLTNSPLTNVKITLLAFKSHLKHTEPSDFKEAINRAIRHALIRSNNILLEPYYHFEIIIDNQYLSRLLFDLDNFNAEYEIINLENNEVRVQGEVSVRKISNYNSKLLSYTKGTGKIILNFEKYDECLEQDEIVEQIGYDALQDIDNQAGSIFCAKGAGFYVPYYEVENYMHIPFCYVLKERKQSPNHNKTSISDDELKRVWSNLNRSSNKEYVSKEIKPETYKSPYINDLGKCLIVDGYNVIFEWDELKNLEIDNARSKLIERMMEYQAFKYDLVVVVFDAYKVKGSYETLIKNDHFMVVYTKEKEIADVYIEKLAIKLSKNYIITIASSDALVQLQTIKQKALRISSRQLINDYQTFKLIAKNRLNDMHSKVLNQPLKDLLKDFKID